MSCPTAEDTCTTPCTVPYEQSMYCLCTVYVQSMYCLCTVYVQSMYSLCTVYVQSMYSLCTVYVQSMYCLCTVCTVYALIGDTFCMRHIPHIKKLVVICNIIFANVTVLTTCQIIDNVSNQTFVNEFLQMHIYSRFREYHQPLMILD